jgi:hypothetical protein
MPPGIPMLLAMSAEFVKITYSTASPKMNVHQCTPSMRLSQEGVACFSTALSLVGKKALGFFSQENTWAIGYER